MICFIGEKKPFHQRSKMGVMGGGSLINVLSYSILIYFFSTETAIYPPLPRIGRASSNGKPAHCTLPFLFLCISPLYFCISVRSLHFCISLPPGIGKAPSNGKAEQCTPPPLPSSSPLPENICPSTHYQWKPKVSDVSYFSFVGNSSS